MQLMTWHNLDNKVTVLQFLLEALLTTACTSASQQLYICSQSSQRAASLPVVAESQPDTVRSHTQAALQQLMQRSYGKRRHTCHDSSMQPLDR